MKNFFRLLVVFGINAVPAVGWYHEGWSAGTTLALYWVENVVATLLVAARIYLHSKVNPRRGHFHYWPRESGKPAARGKRKSDGSLLMAFLPTSLIFSAAHGIFLFGLIFVLSQNEHGAEIALNRDDLVDGSCWMSAGLLAGFLLDLHGLKDRPFAWAEGLVGRMLSRVVLMQLTIIFGMFAVAITGATRAFFTVFIVLKTLNDLSFSLPQWVPQKPPVLLGKVMNKLPNVHPGETFEDFWKKDQETELQREQENEQPE